MKTIIVRIIRAYQIFLGPLFPRVCRFEPTCSSYAIEAIDRFGIVRGGLLSMWRIMRCNPLCRGGSDPVPFSYTGGKETKHD